MKDTLAADILMMIAGNFDQWQPGADMETIEANVHSAKLVAEGIARKLTDAINHAPGELNARRWKQLVKDATRDSFIELPGCPLVKLGDNPSFVAAVAGCTASTVAPAGSDWARAVAAQDEHRNRRQLEAMGLPPREVEKMMQKWRARQRTKSGKE